MAMRSALRTVALVASLLALSVAGVAAARTAAHPTARRHGVIERPTRHQIAVAVARAQRSQALWATVNECSASGKLGIRGQMPTLGFPASLWMTIQVRGWSFKQHRFIALKAPSATVTLALGSQSTQLQQDGEVFPFPRHSGLLDATITFSWTRGGKTIGSAVATTTAGHPSADFGSPPHFSAAQCRIS